jgi:hypothetical protein
MAYFKTGGLFRDKTEIIRHCLPENEKFVQHPHIPPEPFGVSCTGTGDGVRGASPMRTFLRIPLCIMTFHHSPALLPVRHHRLCQARWHHCTSARSDQSRNKKLLISKQADYSRIKQ